MGKFKIFLLFASVLLFLLVYLQLIELTDVLRELTKLLANKRLS
ncbi:hypothetical protein BLGI_4068 [Brevibacillus laterosporus GI-9]|nr:hypothetical protein BLGI_1385 [Brevibacillus laterosporus GI-9]CCF16110.1 hypothetical protein BLGI_4068 [Brevibacillus laterosporus GI-9]